MNNVRTRRLATSAVMSILVGCLWLASAGCDQGPEKPADLPELVPVTITVTYNGEPVEGANVLLAPTSGKFSAAGITDAGGKAVMKTDAKYEGVPAGEYQATVAKREKLDWEPPPQPKDPSKYMEWEAELKNQPMPEHLLPEKYSKFTTSDLTVTVSEGSPVEETLELTD